MGSADPVYISYISVRKSEIATLTSRVAFPGFCTILDFIVFPAQESLSRKSALHVLDFDSQKTAPVLHRRDL